MTVKTIQFNGRNVAWVTVNETAYGEARRIIDGTTPPAERERVAVTKLREAMYPCAVATDASHDVRVTIAGVVYSADIKTLYLSHGVPDDNSRAAQTDIWATIDHAYDKEVGQGTTALFDLSYLNAALREGTIGGIHNTYPKAITLWYSHDGREVHLNLPDVHHEYHHRI